MSDFTVRQNRGIGQAEKFAKARAIGYGSVPRYTRRNRYGRKKLPTKA
jgi:hypothetical protein